MLQQRCIFNREKEHNSSFMCHSSFSWSVWTQFPNHKQLAAGLTDITLDLVPGCPIICWMHFMLIWKKMQVTHYSYFSFKKLYIIKVLRKESLQYRYPVLTSRLSCSLNVISLTNMLGNLALSPLTHCFLNHTSLYFSMCTEAAQVPNCYLSDAEIQIGSGIPPRHLIDHNVVGINPSLSSATSCWVMQQQNFSHL